jgi:hypothetical protein
MSEGRDGGPLDFDEEPPAEHVPLREPPQPPAPRRPVQAPRFLWVVGAAAIVLVVVLGVSTLRHGTERGARGLEIGTVMPPFAAPSGRVKSDADVNLATKGHTNDDVGNEPACTVRGPNVVNGCALREAGPVVLAFFVIKAEKCVAQLDAMQQVLRQVPGVRFAAIAVRGDQGDLQAMIRRHHWTFPIGWDQDGALSGAYHAQICPQITFARRGGRVAGTTFGLLAPPELVAKIRALGLS